MTALTRRSVVPRRAVIGGLDEAPKKSAGRCRQTLPGSRGHARGWTELTRSSDPSSRERGAVSRLRNGVGFTFCSSTRVDRTFPSRSGRRPSRRGDRVVRAILRGWQHQCHRPVLDPLDVRAKRARAVDVDKSDARCGMRRRRRDVRPSQDDAVTSLNLDRSSIGELVRSGSPRRLELAVPRPRSPVPAPARSREAEAVARPRLQRNIALPALALTQRFGPPADAGTCSSASRSCRCPSTRRSQATVPAAAKRPSKTALAFADRG